MSFRQKSAAITLAALLLASGWYFAQLQELPRAGAALQGALLLKMVVGMSAIAIAGHVAVAAYRPFEAQAGTDERERTFELRASRLGFVTLIAGALGAASSALFGLNSFAVANCVFAAVVLAEAVHYSAFLLLHRVG